MIIDKPPRTAVVTGGASGIGRAVCRRLAAAGVQIAVADLDFQSASQTADEIVDAGGGARPFQIDVSDPGSVQACFRDARAWLQHVDILVTSAGVLSVHALPDFPIEIWKKVMEVNVTGTFLCVLQVAHEMIERQFGRIVTISSISGVRAGVGRTAYGTSKAAVMALTRQLAMELAPHGVTANSVAPGPVLTPLIAKTHNQETMAAYTAMIPAGRMGTVEEIADAVVFLASDQAGYINGQTLAVDGGYLAAGVARTADVAQ